MKSISQRKNRKKVGKLREILLMLTAIALVSATASHSIVGYKPAPGSEGQMHIMGVSEEVRAMPVEEVEPYYGSYQEEGGYEKMPEMRPGMDKQGRMVRPGPQLDPEEVMALDVDVDGGEGQAHIMESGEVRALRD